METPRKPTSVSVTTACTDCRVEFAYEHKGGPIRQRCNDCKAKRKRATDSAKSLRWRQANPERAREQFNRYNRKRLADPEYLRSQRDKALLRNYGITRAEFNALVEAQGGKCAICRGDRIGPGLVLHTDHCHETGRVRGLLCSRCNTAVGLLKNDPALADALAVYLRLE
jgi:hypothetical protein